MELAAYEAKLQWAIRLSQQATERDKQGRYEEAFELYKLALDQWNILRKAQSNAIVRGKLCRKMHEYISRAEALKVMLAQQQKPQSCTEKCTMQHPTVRKKRESSPLTGAAAEAAVGTASLTAEIRAAAELPRGLRQGGSVYSQRPRQNIDQQSVPLSLQQKPVGSLVSNSQRSASLNSSAGVGSGATENAVPPGSSGSARAAGDADCFSEEEKMREKLAAAIVTEKPDVCWDDIAGLEAAKDALQEAVILPSRFPSLFTALLSEAGKEKYSHRLYVGDAPASQIRRVGKESAAAYVLSSADLVSKWQGESEKLVRALFAMARDRRPSIIFIDEVDSMCGARSEGDSDSSRRIKTEFLVQMQGLHRDSAGMLVLGATNVPWTLDSAIRRRFEKRVYIPLPGFKARMRLVSLCLGRTTHRISASDLRLLAEQTEGFSGADISVVVRDALFQPLRRCRAATHFKRVVYRGSVFLTPCEPTESDSTVQAMTLMDVPADRLLPPVVTMADFENVLRNARPSVSPEDIRKHDEWTRQYGVEGQ